VFENKKILQLKIGAGLQCRGYQMLLSKVINWKYKMFYYLPRCSASSFSSHACITQEEKFVCGFSFFSSLTIFSIASINSCGKRIPLKVDLLFLCPVLIFSHNLCGSPGNNLIAVRLAHEVFKHKTLDVFKHLEVTCLNTSVCWYEQMNEAPKCCNTSEASDLSRY